jgi:uncharacterized protein YdeI (YjbR/CyaY-like superfamily)
LVETHVNSNIPGNYWILDTMVEITETFFAEDRVHWREWLDKYHSKKSEVWLIIYKKHVKEDCVSYDEAVEEALCFGWIDGTLKRIDDREHAIRFTPRRKNSIWSESNLERINRMINEKKVTPPGLEIFNARDPEKTAPSVKYRGKEVPVPEYIEEIFKEDEEIWEKFSSMPPSHKNQYIGWIDTAKKEETRIRRAKKAVDMIRKEEVRGRGK